jgi:uncharacterized protein involved in outer membrane biogenesis
MDAGKRKRLTLIALAIVAVLIVGVVVGFQVAVRTLKGKVVEALGPNGEIKDIRLGWSSVNVEGLRIKGPSGWPAADALRAERVAVVPSLRGLLSRQYQVRSITIVKPYLSVLRTKEGKFLVLPGLLTGATSPGGSDTLSNPGAASSTVAIGRITLKDGVVELYDATVAEPPLKIRLEQIKATVRDMAVPGLKGRSRFEIAGVVKGVHRDGQLTMEGWAEMKTKDSSIKTELRSVDLVVLQPYLIKPGERGVQKGTLDLDMQSDVNNSRLKAPGKATISDLELIPAKGGFDTFMGLPREAILAFLMRNGNKITVDFVLEGDINNPQFSLNQSLTTHVAFAIAKTLGVNIGGMAKDVGTLGQKGGEAAGQAAKSTGGWLHRLFRGNKKD